MEYLMETSRLLETVLAHSPSAILIAEPDGTILLANRELQRTFGYAADELVGQSVDLIVPEGLQPVPAGAPETPDIFHSSTVSELVGRRKDGTEIAVEVGLERIPAGNRVYVLASMRDLDEGRLLEDARRAALEEQLKTERFIAESAFQFINLPDNQVNDAIKECLGRLGDQLELDRSSFYTLDRDGSLLTPIAWAAPGVTPLTEPVPARTNYPWTFDRLLEGETVAISTIEEVPSETDRDSYGETDTRSAVIVPLSVEGRVAGIVTFCMTRAERSWPPDVVHRLEMIGNMFAQVLARQQRDEAARAATREVERLKTENVYLRREERERLGPTHVVGQSPSYRRVLSQVHQVAPTDATVLLRGETGTGKELLAAYIHELSTRHSRAMVRVNCAAIPATLIESELFGREKGAFTGALTRQTGRFELADHSTIFLDEIGDLSPDVQVKLLRVLEERTIERLGNPRPISVNTRIIAATHRNLEQLTAEGTFREDLYYRLNVFPIEVPPLRMRVEDIPLLLWRFVEEFSKSFGRRIDTIERDNIAALQAYPWPGNIRELRNVVERAMIATTGRRLTIALPQTSTPSRRGPKLAEVEKEHIRAVLESTGWRIRGTGGAADRLGLKPTTLETRIIKLGLKRPGLG
jgi:PAS domain S-box-containing protein